MNQCSRESEWITTDRVKDFSTHYRLLSKAYGTMDGHLHLIRLKYPGWMDYDDLL